MTIKLIVDNINIPVKHIKFSDGSSNIKLEIPEGFSASAYSSITVCPTTPVDVYTQEIGLACYAMPWELRKTILNLPYLPHGRADRVFENGNPCPLELFFDDLTNYSDGFEIHLTDPHSDYYLKYEDYFDFVVKPQHDCFIDLLKNNIQSGDVLVSPDKGALSKIYKLQLALDYRMIATQVIEATKTRDITTGKILSTDLPKGVDLADKVVYIVDDILDAGGTFIPLAEKLREAGAKEVHLYVTHGIFAKGLDIFKGVIDKLHVYQIVGTYVTMGDINNFNNGLEVK